ncbi:MAG: hypothetical protein JSV88_15775 [Candidatus Aminicenantes bacterium]|nr:MAG: hypothetical protein JSV88_15775 [Candidatus Aminicenantes bacterium]
MKIGKCQICDSSLAHSDKAIFARCYNCGKGENTYIKCVDDHYLCNSCVSNEIMGTLYEKIPKMTERNPLDIAEKIFIECGVSGNTPHPILAGAFLMSFKNTTNSITYGDVLEGIKRTSKISGGWCGYYGACGAAVALGVCFSIIKKATPMHDKERSLANIVTAHGLQAVASQGGPRCCVGSVRGVLNEGTRLVKIHLGIDFPAKRMNSKGCFFSKFNLECKKKGVIFMK